MSTDPATKRITDGSTWNDFCDRLKELGRLVERPETPDAPRNRALGYRYLTKLLRAGLESSLDYRDPELPAFFRLADETKKMLNDNSDTCDQNCVIAHHDPGPRYPNWLDTCGHDQGGMIGRYIGTKTHPKEMPAEVLASRFPEMAVCPNERVEILGGVLRGPRALWVQTRDSQTVRS